MQVPRMSCRTQILSDLYPEMNTCMLTRSCWCWGIKECWTWQARQQARTKWAWIRKTINIILSVYHDACCINQWLSTFWCTRAFKRQKEILLFLLLLKLCITNYFPPQTGRIISRTSTSVWTDSWKPLI